MLSLIKVSFGVVVISSKPRVSILQLMVIGFNERDLEEEGPAGQCAHTPRGARGREPMLRCSEQLLFSPWGHPSFSFGGLLSFSFCTCQTSCVMEASRNTGPSRYQRTAASIWRLNLRSSVRIGVRDNHQRHRVFQGAGKERSEERCLLLDRRPKLSEIVPPNRSLCDLTAAVEWTDRVDLIRD